MAKIVPLLSLIGVSIFFCSVFSFCKIKGYCSEYVSKLTINWKDDHNVTIYWNDVIINFFEGFLFLLLSLVTGWSFMSVSSVVLELLQVSFKRIDHKSENCKYTCLSFSQYLTTEASYWYQILHKSLMKCYWMLQLVLFLSYQGYIKRGEE